MNDQYENIEYNAIFIGIILPEYCMIHQKFSNVLKTINILIRCLIKCVPMKK